MIPQRELQSAINALCDQFQIKHLRIRYNYRLRGKYGRINYDKRLIEISALPHSNKVIADTILHEFAHALAFDLKNHAGHGLPWKHYMRELGVSKPRATEPIAEPTEIYRYKYDCGKGCVAYGHNIRPAYERRNCLKHRLPFSREYIGE